MSFAVLSSNDVIDFSNMKCNCFVLWILRIILVLGVFFVPVIITLKATNLSIKKKKIVAGWRRNRNTGESKESVSRAWLRYTLLDQNKEELKDLFSTLKTIGASLEGVPQMFILSTLLTVTYLLPETTHLGLAEDDSFGTNIFLGWSLFLSYASVISTYISSMNMKKGSQLDVTKKIILGMAFSFLLLGRLFSMTNIAIAAFPQTDLDSEEYGAWYDAALSPEKAAILLTAPILLQWAILLFYYNTSEKPVFNQLSKWHKILHILGNTWISIPARSVHQVDQHLVVSDTLVF